MIGATGAVEAALAKAETGSAKGPVERSFAQALSDAESDRQERWDQRVEEQRKLREDPERIQRAQEGAEQLVAATFIVPILQQLRESNMAAEPFGPGMYEKRLGPMLDAQVADRIVSAQGLPIVDAIRDRMLGLSRSRLEPETPGDDRSNYGAGQ